MESIQNGIEKRKLRKNHLWIKKLATKLRLYSADDKDVMLTALQRYQIRASISGNVIIDEIRTRCGATGIPEDVNKLLQPIIKNLVSLLLRVVSNTYRIK